MIVNEWHCLKCGVLTEQIVVASCSLGIPIHRSEEGCFGRLEWVGSYERLEILPRPWTPESDYED